MKIVFTGGGTAGHIFPGLAVADSLRSLTQEQNRQLELFWIGSKKENEQDLVREYDIPFFSIPTGKLRRYFSLRNVLDLFKVLGGIIASLHLLLKIKPDMLFSKGGYVAVPPCIAAKLLRIPIMVHESDFSPGLTTRITAKFAGKIFVSYKETIAMFAQNLQANCVYTGNPVRKKFYTASGERGKRFLAFPDTNKKILLVIGGSLGAAQINNLVAESITALCENFFVVHQLGAANFAQHTEIEKKLAAYNPTLVQNYKAFQFIGFEMPDVLAASDLVVSRAGANSLWEIISQAKPCILIPLSTASSRGDQYENASFFEAAACAKVLTDKNVTAQNFLNCITELITDEKKYKDMCAASKNILPEPASTSIAKIILNQEEK